MRASIIKSLRKAGDKVRAFDDAYAAKLADYIGGISTKQGSMGDNLQSAALMATGIPATRRFDTGEVANTMQGAQMLHGLMGYGLPALNAGVRYGLPAAGAIGLQQGISGLYDLASSTPISGQHVEAIDAMLANGEITLEQRNTML